VEDVLAAAEFLAKQPGIDPQRIYLGGHSTGGTLALLAAAASPRFRAVFAFGPVSRISNYGLEILTYSGANLNEHRLRDPENWIHLIHSPTYVLEGEDGNSDSVRALEPRESPAAKHGADAVRGRGSRPFNIIAPLSRQIAKQIITDTGASPAFTFSLGSQPLAPQ
jgi:acetyl esterase/lipase